jgi:hypothetical protein
MPINCFINNKTKVLNRKTTKNKPLKVSNPLTVFLSESLRISIMNVFYEFNQGRITGCAYTEALPDVVIETTGKGSM